MSLDRQVALVTGAGQGVGQGIALALAGRGASVVAVGRTFEKVERTAEQIRERGYQAQAIECDVTNADDVSSLPTKVLGKFGSLSILVNNAQSVVNGRLLDVSDADYECVMQSGPFATFRLMRACHPLLSGGGSIVNVGSAAGVRWDSSGYGVYAAAKEAIRSLTRAAACEWANDGIRVNAIIPLSSSPSLTQWADSNKAEAEAYLSTIPMGRFGDPETDIGAAVAFLCSDDARYVTGHSLPVDGGQVLMQ